MRVTIFLLAAALLVPQAARAVITFTQLDDDVFVVSHRVKVIGLRGKAMKLVYTKTASLCVAAGYSHLRILEQESETGQADDSANASIRAQFYFADGEDRVGCERNADPEYIQQARAKLAKQGYRPPEPGAVGAKAAEGASSGSVKPEGSSCAIEQIAAMARAGLSDEQIRAACVQ
ncbi:MAG: hypothetical protein GY769_05290 [bacterium]|nr:hypothetical protein [bacterium]